MASRGRHLRPVLRIAAALGVAGIATSLPQHALADATTVTARSLAQAELSAALSTVNAAAAAVNGTRRAAHAAAVAPVANVVRSAISDATRTTTSAVDRAVSASPRDMAAPAAGSGPGTSPRPAAVAGRTHASTRQLAAVARLAEVRALITQRPALAVAEPAPMRGLLPQIQSAMSAVGLPRDALRTDLLELTAGSIVLPGAIGQGRPRFQRAIRPAPLTRAAPASGWRTFAAPLWRLDAVTRPQASPPPVRPSRHPLVRRTRPPQSTLWEPLPTLSVPPMNAPITSGGPAAAGVAAAGAGSAVALVAGGVLILLFLLSTRVSLYIAAWRSALLSRRLERPG